MNRLRLVLRTLTLVGAAFGWHISAAAAEPLLSRYLGEIEPSAVVPETTRFGPATGSPPGARAYDGDELLGYVFLTSDLVNTVGYSGKPIHIVVGIDLDGTITGAELVHHEEPIVLIGIPEARMDAFVSNFAGRNVIGRSRDDHAQDDDDDSESDDGDHDDKRESHDRVEHRAVDAVSGATVTVMVIEDSILRASRKFARSRGLGGLSPLDDTRGAKFVLAPGEAQTADWETLLGEGSVRRLHLSVKDVSEVFREMARSAATADDDDEEHDADEDHEESDEGDPRHERYLEAASRAESDDSEAIFIDLYAGLATIPTIGMSLLGDRQFTLLQERLEAGQHAMVVAGRGLYSFKGSGYVRGGIFDRIQVIQGDRTIRFRDRNHTRISDIAAAGAPDFDEIALFRIPTAADFDPARPWRLELLVQRPIGAREKVFTTFDLAYSPPQKYLERVEPTEETVQPPPTQAESATATEDEAAARDALWQRIWQARVLDIAILLTALTGLTLMFFFQDWLVRRPRLTGWIRYGFLAFTLVWIGFYARAQLSVVNILTFSNSLLEDFSWAYFLMDPMVFILWIAVAVSLIFWGRGVFCGWLCPFGALQEITNHIGRRLGIRQLNIPWGLNERLWPIKYMIFLGLFGFSLYSLALAETLAEVEPFKTAIVLHFVRSWPFVAFAVGLLVAGLFVERFFCRYLCPLGAALAIPARLRMFDWLKRHPECGSPCQRCANECPVQAIHPDGRINVNECIYCLDCQKLYYDDRRCPHMIQQRLKRERRAARSSEGMMAAAGARGGPAIS